MYLLLLMVYTTRDIKVYIYKGIYICTCCYIYLYIKGTLFRVLERERVLSSYIKEQQQVHIYVPLYRVLSSYIYLPAAVRAMPQTMLRKCAQHNMYIHTFNMYICVNVCMYVCMYVCVYVCIYVYIYIYRYDVHGIRDVCMYIYIYIYVHGIRDVCMYICMYVYICIFTYIHHEP